MSNNANTKGLAGVTAGQTSIATVGKEGKGLTYCGYTIEDLAEHSTFEEVAFLLMQSRLPLAGELEAFHTQLQKHRTLPDPLKMVLEQLPSSSLPMDVLRTGCSTLGCLEPEMDFTAQRSVVIRLLASLPSMLMYWHHFSHNGNRIDTNTTEKSIASHFLKMLTGSTPSELNERALDVSLILYAEHEFNASTFVSRITASTLSDIYSTITGGIGALRGPLHGGANEAAMEFIERFKTPAEAETGVLEALACKDKIMGFGHRIYTTSDPRSAIIKQWAKRLSKDTEDSHLFAVSERIEEVMWREKRIFPNLDFYCATAYHTLQIPTSLFTPIFVMSRTAGWAAHVFEQRADNRLIRPNADYIGPDTRSYIPIADRSESN
jgi:2-methylcitrate synthase